MLVNRAILQGDANSVAERRVGDIASPIPHDAVPAVAPAGAQNTKRVLAATGGSGRDGSPALGIGGALGPDAEPGVALLGVRDQRFTRRDALHERVVHEIAAVFGAVAAAKCFGRGGARAALYGGVDVQRQVHGDVARRVPFDGVDRVVRHHDNGSRHIHAGRDRGRRSRPPNVALFVVREQHAVRRSLRLAVHERRAVGERASVPVERPIDVRSGSVVVEPTG